MIIGDGIALKEFQSRRERLAKSLGGATAIVFAGEAHTGPHHGFEPDWNFYYLTGIRSEPGAAVIFDPANDDPSKRIVLALKPLSPELERWDGYREPITQRLKDETGFASVVRTSMIPRILSAGGRRSGRFACLHPFAVYDAPVSPDLVVFRRVVERTLGVRIEDQTQLLPSMRAIKSKAEIAALNLAVGASHRGYVEAAAMIRPGVSEADVQKVLEDGFMAAGAVGTGYGSIVGAGMASTVLHYRANNQPLRDGDVLLIDAGARVGGYTADITRTFPVSGRFTPEQRKVYEIVLEALEAATAAVKPGKYLHEIDEAARKVIRKAGYNDAYIHGIGHQLGIEVHDSAPDGPLKAGMVITIEPGIYLPESKLGVRIEDDVLVTATGRQVLSKAIPKSVKDVEAMVGA